MARVWTEEMLETLRNECGDMSYAETADYINAKHGTNITTKNVKTGRGNHKISSTRTGRFEKGIIPWNKGISFQAGGRSAETRFKKGNIPHNHRPVGSERITKDGYVEIKVAEPDKWELKHRVVWEEHHGEVPKDHIVTFIDLDRTNCNIDNLKMISMAQNAVLNKMFERPENEELYDLTLQLTDLHMKVKERKRKQKRVRNGETR